MRNQDRGRWDERDEDNRGRARGDWNESDDFSRQRMSRQDMGDDDGQYGSRQFGGGRESNRPFGQQHGQQYGWGSSEYRNRGEFGGGMRGPGIQSPQSGFSGGIYGAAGESGLYGRDSQQGMGQRERKGPKGYTRSDERLKDDICERLMQSDVDVEEVSVEVKNGTVTLEGTVPERYMKHRIEDIACNCMGVKDVENRVRVGRSGEQNESASSGSTSSSRSKREH